MMNVQTAVMEFVEECARRDGSKAVSEAAVRGAIKGYVKCLGIAYRGRRELTEAQMARAMRHYNRRRAAQAMELPLSRRANAA